MPFHLNAGNLGCVAGDGVLEHTALIMSLKWYEKTLTTKVLIKLENILQIKTK